MKVKIKETGEIINIAKYAKVTTDKCDSYGDPIEFNYDEVELIQDDTSNNINWEQRRFILIKSIIQGMCINLDSNVDYKLMANYAIKQADAIINLLKEK